MREVKEIQILDTITNKLYGPITIYDLLQNTDDGFVFGTHSALDGIENNLAELLDVTNVDGDHRYVFYVLENVEENRTPSSKTIEDKKESSLSVTNGRELIMKLVSQVMDQLWNNQELQDAIADYGG